MTEKPVKLKKVQIRIPLEVFQAMARDGRRWLYCAQHAAMPPDEFERRIDQRIAIEDELPDARTDVPLTSEIM